VNETVERELFHPGPVLAALALGGVFMIAHDRWRRSDRGDAPGAGSGLTIDDHTWPSALQIGVMQAVAMWPGTSRSMMTITGGVVVGLRPRDAAEFSFLLGLPTLGGACAFTLAKDVADNGAPDTLLSLGLASVLVGLTVAALSAAAAIKWLVAFLNRHGLEPFGWYRIVLAAALLALWQLGIVQFVA
jgi:undecaprenyl-diphosphatase